MRVKFNIKREVQLQPDLLEEKINKYLIKNFYRVLESGPDFIIFKDDEYSKRKRYRSDFHTRIGEGKFEFHATEKGTFVQLIYLTPVLYPFFLMMLFAGVGMYSRSLMPILFSFAFLLPVAYKVYYLHEHVINEILEC